MDIILKNANLIDPENLKITYGVDILIKNGKIEKVEKNCCFDATTVIDCKGKYVAPSFIDAHVHIESSMVAPCEFSKCILARGTTAIIADPHEIVNVGGVPALDAFLDMADKAVCDVFTVLPSSVPATKYDTNGAGKFLAQDMRKYLFNPKVVGLGEVMCFNDVLAENPEILDKIKLFKDKTIDGHTAGLDAKLVKKYASYGISNDHECANFDDAVVRYEAGMNVYIRQGSAARNAQSILEGIVANQKTYPIGNKNRFDLGRFAFCTDDKHLSDIFEEGHIDCIFRLAVKLGLGLEQASMLASYNAAKFYGLEDRGSVAVGKIADLVILNAESLMVECVLKNGKVAYCNGKLTLSTQNGGMFLDNMKNSVNYKTFTRQDFEDKLKNCNTAIRVQQGQLLTDFLQIQNCDKAKLNMLATIERYGKNGNFSICYLEGYGLKNGALAISVSHDSHNVVVAGDNTNDMAVAVNRLKEIGGGIVLVSSGSVAKELALDIAGLMSSKDGKTVKKDIFEITKLAKRKGVFDGIDPIVTLSFVALPVIPFARLLDTGLFDVCNGRFLN